MFLLKNDSFNKKQLLPDETPFEYQLKSVWGDWGVSSEVAPLRAVLMRRPGREIEEFDWQQCRFRSGIDPVKFREQFDSLVYLYKQYGIDVYFVQEQREDRPNAVYVRDLLFMMPTGAIICRPALPVRRGEEVAVAKQLAILNVPIVRTITGNGTFEGADCFWVDRKTVIIATSKRTNIDAFEQLEFEFKRIGVEKIIHTTVPYSNAHLDGMMSIVDYSTVIINPIQVPYDLCKELSSKGFTIIEAPSHDETQQNLALNMVVIRPGLVVQAAGNPLTKRILEDNGIEVVNIDFDEVLKGWGSVHCCTAPLKRG